MAERWRLAARKFGFSTSCLMAACTSAADKRWTDIFDVFDSWSGVHGHLILIYTHSLSTCLLLLGLLFPKAKGDSCLHWVCSFQKLKQYTGHLGSCHSSLKERNRSVGEPAEGSLPGIRGSRPAPTPSCKPVRRPHGARSCGGGAAPARGGLLPPRPASQCKPCLETCPLSDYTKIAKNFQQRISWFWQR